MSPPPILDKAHLIRKIGNQAAHNSARVSKQEALNTVRELFQLLRWHARRYGDPARRAVIPETFDLQAIPPAAERIAAAGIRQLRKREQELQERDEELRAARTANAAIQQQLDAARAEVAAFLSINTAAADTADYNEADTRATFIDRDLREAGWNPRDHNVREFPVTGMPTPTGRGFADYVLWDDDGLPLAVVEAKRTTKDAAIGRQQAKLYADCLEQMTGRRPVIFYTNGYTTYLWDDVAYPPRRVHGFYSQDELQRLIQRRTDADPLSQVASDPNIAGRYYQERAIRRITESLAARRRKALLVMATGAGKTRTVIGLVDLLMRAGWVKRVLFLADRQALVRQAARAFRAHLPASDPVNLLTLSSADKVTARNARVVVSTYHTILNRLDAYMPDGVREYGVGHFDLVIIDEAHRSVFRRFRAIFDYCDSLLLGLTATPKDEIDRNTYELFDLQTGVPTDAYGLEDAVADNYLVPPRALSIPSVIMRRGLRYDDLTPEQQAEWDELDWGEDGPPDVVNAGEINQALYNLDTIDKVLQHLMTHGLHVAGGDRLGETIIFARNQRHAELIEQRFNHHYPHYAGHFARVISYKEPRAETLIDEFGTVGKPPHIAISVDMLDTGIDIPEVVNLVFFKPVYSRTKFIQMIGRGTRLCPNLFGPGVDKTEFYIFDFCQNFEYFNANPQRVEPRVPERLSAQLFKRRLELLAHLQKGADSAEPVGVVRDESQGYLAGSSGLVRALRDTLHAYIAGMPRDNFLVRPHQELVDAFADRDRWSQAGTADFDDLARRLADLPSSAEDGDDESARRFDLLVTQLQLALLHRDARFTDLHERLLKLVANLAAKPTIPLIATRLPLLEEIQESDWWTSVTIGELERVRRDLRDLIQFVDTQERKSVIVNITDTFGDETVQPVGPFIPNVDLAAYRRRVDRFVQQVRDHPIVRKITSAEPLSTADVVELERIFYSAGAAGSREQFERVYGPHQHLTVFLRRTLGLDRAAAKAIFADYLDDKRFSADQISFIDHLINHLTANGVIDPTQLYAAPFTHVNHAGPEGLFPDPLIDSLFTLIERINTSTQPPPDARSLVNQ